MSFFSPILGQIEEGGAEFDHEMRNRLITFGAYSALLLILLIWAICIRKQRAKRRRIHRPHNWQVSEPLNTRRRHRRREKKAELPKNPSRAEAGGLPPRREEPLPPED